MPATQRAPCLSASTAAGGHSSAITHCTAQIRRTVSMHTRRLGPCLCLLGSTAICRCLLPACGACRWHANTLLRRRPPDSSTSRLAAFWDGGCRLIICLCCSCRGLCRLLLALLLLLASWLGCSIWFCGASSRHSGASRSSSSCRCDARRRGLLCSAYFGSCSCGHARLNGSPHGLQLAQAVAIHQPSLGHVTATQVVRVVQTDPSTLAAVALHCSPREQHEASVQGMKRGHLIRPAVHSQPTNCTGKRNN